jgi:hypothetical protein
VPDWAGGTRIGDALRTFNVNWTRRVMGHGPVVLLISDGWDRGDPDRLAREMARLQRSCHRLIWLNPLLRGRTIAAHARHAWRRCHLDDFLTVHNLASPEALAAHLNRLPAPWCTNAARTQCPPSTHPEPFDSDAQGPALRRNLPAAKRQQVDHADAHHRGACSSSCRRPLASRCLRRPGPDSSRSEGRWNVVRASPRVRARNRKPSLASFSKDVSDR